MIIGGCDSAKKGVAFVILPNADKVWIPKPNNKFLYQDLLKFYFEECNKINCDILYIEDVPYVRNVQTLKELSEILAIIKLSFILRNIKISPINNMSWKKNVVGSGKATKEEIKQKAIELGAPTNLRQDLYDAWCIAYHGVKEYNNGRA